MRSGIPNRNEGSSSLLSVNIGSTHRSLLYFDSAAIRAAAAGHTLLSAHIDLTIQGTSTNWGTGRPIAIHSMRQASSEAAATWSCASDSNVFNNQPDCSGATAWNMAAANGTLPFELAPTATTNITNGQGGIVTFDVTPDVEAIVAETNAGLGWLVKKVNESLSGGVTFVSREQSPGPVLRLALESPDPCTPTATTDVSCDGQDDDCDGEADEDYVPSTTTCGVGACGATGTLACALGELEDSCQPGEPAGADATCNGVDEDCDGISDEDFVGGATSCGVGVCAATGTTACVSGQVTDSCQPGTPTTNDATCDGIDSDCDGTSDEDYLPIPTSCGVGACLASGSTSCVVGAVIDSCSPGVGTSLDLACDGIDADCDGANDEEYVPVATACGVGACAASGSTSCADGAIVDGCLPGAPAAADASCDGIDDDCDGPADEDFERRCAGSSVQSCQNGAIDNRECSDADACNGTESCVLAECQPNAPPEVDDGNPCTADACEPASGVAHTPLVAGTPCGAYRACNDSAECRSLLPPDPADVAPALPIGAVSFLDSVRYIFEGTSPIQTGVVPGSLRERTAAVLRGRLLDENEAPLPGTVVSVHGHPELGQTLTRFDGRYDLVVNGGGQLTLDFSHAGYLSAQRTTSTPWQEYAFVDDVALAPPDPESSALVLPLASTSIHRATLHQDARGERAATVYVPSGTQAELVSSNGSSAQLANLSLRATEFAVGSTGALGSPAELAESAAFAYSVELSADEAAVAGTERVELSQPIAVYVDNFLELPVGSALPVGSYDRAQAKWLGLYNGRVIALLAVSSGLAELDVDGSGSAAGAATLDGLGITSEERSALALLYEPGTSFWRTQVQHLAPFDFGMPYRTDLGTGGNVAPLPASPPVAESQILSLTLPPVPGTTLALHYRSDRVLGHRLGRSLDVAATGAAVSNSLLGSLVDIRVAGQRHRFTLEPLASSVVHFGWDGRDGEGRLVHGERVADVWVGSLYPRSYVAAGGFQSAYTQLSPSGALLVGAEDVDVRWQRYRRGLSSIDARDLGIGAWSFYRHHRYDPVGRVLYRGDGRRLALGTSEIIERFAGNPQLNGLHSGDGGAALSAGLTNPRSVAVGPDGALYIGTQQGVRRVDPDTAIITTVAGGKDLLSCNPNLEDGPALGICLFARKIDFGRDGALYITDNPVSNSMIDRVRRLDLATGQISHVAGRADPCNNTGDGGLAVDAGICNLVAHASGPDGSLYLIDRGPLGTQPKVRKISPNSIIETIYTGNWGGTDDSADLAVGPDGSVYIARSRIVERIRPTGEVQRFAGDPAANGSSGDGGLATAARFGGSGPNSVMVGPDGRVYVGDNGNGQIRVVDQAGIIRRTVGTVSGNVSGDGGPPLSAVLGPDMLRTALSPDGLLFVTSVLNGTIRVVRPAVRPSASGEFRLPSEDGNETYRFAPDGRHLDTVVTATGTLLESFGYDAAGRLTSITRDGQTTSIERDESGRPAAIVAPGGQQTLLDTDNDGYLSLVVDPTQGEFELDYDPQGLLVQRTNPDGSAQSYAYDADGRLITE